MFDTRRVRLVATAAVSAALSIGAVTSAQPGPASADTGTATTSSLATYTCTSPVSSLLSGLPAPLDQLGTGIIVPATITLSNLPDVLTANIPVPAGTPLTETIQFPTSGSGLTGVLSGVGVVVNSLLGAMSLSNVTTTYSQGVATINGQLGSLDPAAGLPVPSSFSLDAGLLSGNPLLSGLGVDCQFNAGSNVAPGTDSGPGAGAGAGGTSGTFGSLPVYKQRSAVRAHQVGTTARIAVRVENQTGKASGRVVAKIHHKTVGKGTLRAGKLRMRLKKLPHGVNRVKVFYRGDPVTLASHKTVRVTVTGH